MKKLEKKVTRRKAETNKLAELGQGAPYAMGKESWDSARENGGVAASNNPGRLMKRSVRREDMNDNDRFVQGVAKGTKTARKRTMSEAKLNANARLAKARKMMNEKEK